MTWVFVIAFLVLVVIGFNYLRAMSMPITLTSVDPNDPEILQASADAVRTLPYFWSKRDAAINPDDYFIKIRVVGEKKPEAIWISHPSMEGDMVSGIVDQTPAFIDVKEGERITVKAADICDWMYTEGDKMHGNYVGRVLTKPQAMSKRQFEAVQNSFAPLPTDEETAI